MYGFNAGVLHRANGGVRGFDSGAANELVRRTLAQNGFAAEGTTQPDFVSTVLKGVLGNSATLAAVRTTEEPDLPNGARFLAGSYACAEGSRDYRLYVPSKAVERLNGLVVMLHGCTQTAEDFAAGTQMNALAEKHRFAVLYPQQARGENSRACWNWFSPGDQTRDKGEPAILAGMTRKIVADFGIPSSATFVAGLSAGGAMAVILATTWPDIFAGAGVHSGLPYGSASDVSTAFSAMAGRNVGTASLAPQVPVIVFHGSADATVSPLNADRIAGDVRRGHSGQSLETSERRTVGGRNCTRMVETTMDGRPMIETWRIEGLGHAWSGGNAKGSHTDASGPDASAEMVRFFGQCRRKRT